MIKNVWLYAVRYALTRNTGAMLQVVSSIFDNIKYIEEKELDKIYDECIDHIDLYNDHYCNKNEIEDLIDLIITYQKRR